MHLTWPTEVAVREVGPREGFQSDSAIIPTDVKVEAIRGLVEAGFRKINAVSFANPKVMPQVGDAEAVLTEVGQLKGVEVSGLAPNDRALDRAIDCFHEGVLDTAVLIHSMSSSVLRANGIMATRDEWRDEVFRLARRTNNLGMRNLVFISASWGCSLEGPIDRMDVVREAELLAGSGVVDEIVVSDSTGQASPLTVFELFSAYGERLRGFPVTAHFHDSRGSGLANVASVLQTGLDNLTIDSAFGGLGGDVPFLPEAAGNVATEDLISMCKRSNISTGVDLDAVLRVSSLVYESYERHRTFPSRVLALHMAPPDRKASLGP